MDVAIGATPPATGVGFAHGSFGHWLQGLNMVPLQKHRAEGDGQNAEFRNAEFMAEFHDFQ